MNKFQNINVFSKGWFAVWQPFLLGILNNKFTMLRASVRKLLYINDFDLTDEIVDVGMDYIIADIGNDERKAIFFSGAVMSNRLHKQASLLWKMLHQYDQIINKLKLDKYNVGFDNYTVYPDIGNPGVKSVGGKVHINATSDSNAFLGIGNVSTSTTIQLISMEGSSLSRVVTNYDTSPIGSSSTITSATTSIKRWLQYNFWGTDDVRLVTNTLASDNTITSSDFMNFNSVSQAISDIYMDQYTVGWFTWTLSTTGKSNINKTGISKFGYRYVAKDINGDIQHHHKQFRNSTNLGEEPKLSVTYTIPKNYYTATLLPSVYDDVSSNIKLLYDFGKGGGSTDVSDKSNNSNTGTIVCGVTGDNTSIANMWANGGAGGLNLDGINDYVQLTGTDIFGTQTQGTIEMWVDIETLGLGHQIFFCQGKTTTNVDQLYVYLETDNDLVFVVRLTDGTYHTKAMNTKITEIGLYHIVIANTGSDIEFYLNAINISSTYGSGDSLKWFDDISGGDFTVLGGYVYDNAVTSHMFNGTFFKFAVYDIALTQDQITKIFNYERLFLDSADISSGIVPPKAGYNSSNDKLAGNNPDTGVVYD